MAKEIQEYDAIFQFIRNHQYPPDFDKDQKRVLRRKARKYRIDNARLMYQKTVGSWKEVPRSIEERDRILKLCHATPAGTFITLAL